MKFIRCIDCYDIISLLFRFWMVKVQRVVTAKQAWKDETTLELGDDGTALRQQPVQQCWPTL